MKKDIFLKLILAVVVFFGLVSCSDREIVTVDNTAAPIMMDVSAEKVFLDKHFPDNPALNVTWTPATYSAPTEIKYRIEVSATEDFKTPTELGTVSGSEHTVTYTANQMNKVAQAIGLKPDVAAPMFIRVISYLGSGSVAATSNVSKITITPYELEYPTFYLVGDATYVGWNSPTAQILYKTSNMSYIYTYLENGKSFRFLGQQNWQPLNYSVDQDGIKTEYRYFKQISSNLVKDGDENMKLSGTTGIYKIAINAATGVQSLDVSASAIPTWNVPNLYIVGSMNGWDAAKATAMTKVSDGVFTLTTALADASEFKLLGQQSWGDLEWGNILKDNAGNSGFLGPKGDNGNIKYNGGGATYKITVNLKAGIYTIEKQ